MRLDVARLRLVALTAGEGTSDDVLDRARQALRSGATALWLRERQRERPEIERLGRLLLPECRDAGAALLVAGDSDLAAELGADAVHLGFRDERPEAVRARLGAHIAIGFSAHDPLDRDALAAADYATLSPLFATPKASGGSDTAPLGLDRFARLRREIAIPVVALGGIDASNAASVIAAGADGVCVRRAAASLADVARALSSID